MKVRPLAICTTDFPDDAVETEDGKGFLDHGGRNVAEAIGAILSRLGCTVSAPENAAEYGWRFNWSIEGQTFLCQVSSIPPEHYLHFEGAALNRDVSPRNHRAAEIFAALNAELERDGRFHDVLWYPRIGGTVRFGDEMAAKDPLALEPPVAQPTGTVRLLLLLAGGFALFNAAASVFVRATVAGVAMIAISSMLVLVGFGVIKPRWPRPPSKPAGAKGDDRAPPK